MRPSTVAYHLFLFALVPVALWSFKKINKESFYSHYFRVIEEVELRNSHALPEEAGWWVYGVGSRVQSWGQVRNLFSFLWLGLLGLGLFASCLFLCLAPFKHAYAQEQVLDLPPLRISPPIRAP